MNNKSLISAVKEKYRMLRVCTIRELNWSRELGKVSEEVAFKPRLENE